MVLTLFNISGTSAGFGWMCWSIYNRIKQPYVQKCLFFVILNGIIMLLELADSPPFFYVIDFHSLWHLLSAPVMILYYRYMLNNSNKFKFYSISSFSFGIDDCKYLRKIHTEKAFKTSKMP